jgi:hypothetical protein
MLAGIPRLSRKKSRASARFSDGFERRDGSDPAAPLVSQPLLVLASLMFQPNKLTWGGAWQGTPTPVRACHAVRFNTAHRGQDAHQS